MANGTNHSEGNESVDEQVNNQKKDSNPNKRAFIKEFIKGKTKDKKERLEFLDNIMTSGSISAQQKKEMQDFKDGEKGILEDIAGKKLGKYDDIDLNKISIFDFKEFLRPEYLKLQNKRLSFKELILQEYDITPNLYSSKIESEIKYLDEKELEELVKGPNKNRIKLLKSILGDGNLPEPRLFLPLFDKVELTKRTQKKLKELNGDDKINFELAIQKLNSGVVTSEDIQVLFDFEFFQLEEKKKIIQTFLPFISLEKALKLKLISEEVALDHKKKIVISLLFDENLESQEIQDIANNLNTEDILLSSKYYTLTNFQLDIIGKSEFLNDINFNLSEELNKETKKGLINHEQFKKDLKKTNKVKSSEKFAEGSTIVIKYDIVSELPEVDENGEIKKEVSESVTYLEVKKDGSADGIVELIRRGDGKYNTGYNENETIKVSYESLLSIFAGEKDTKERKTTMVNLLTPQDLKDRKRSGDIVVDESSEKLDFKTIKEIEEEIDTLSEDSRDKYYEAKERIEKSEKYKKIKKENNEEEALKYFLEEIEKDEEYSEISEALEKVYNWNLDYLIRKINDIDLDGKEFGLEEGTTFEVKGKNKEPDVYTIVKVDKVNKNLFLDSIAGGEEISFEDFYKTFKEKDAKRKTKVNGFEDLFNQCIQDSKGELSGPWKGFEFKNDGIYKKDTDYEYDFLVSEGKDKDKKLIKIHGIVGDKIRISFGEVEESGKDEDKKTTFGVGNENYMVTAGFLHNYIKDHNLIPRSTEESKHVKEEDIDTIDRKGKISSKIFKRYSISELISGGKLGIDAIQNYLKEGNEEHAAQFAMSAFGKFLPEELKSDLVTRVEQSQKKRMDDFLDKLKSVDSWMASEMIEKWLLDKNCPEYKKEAGLTFMMEKYGVLYAKNGKSGKGKGLNCYRGKFLWYEALGGKVGDDLYMEKKQECEKLNIPFAEEHLVYVLLVMQGTGKLKPKRRSRLHKEFKKLRAQGKDEEVKTGQTDGADERTVEGRIKGAKGEMMGGTYANAAGWLDTVVDKGGSMAQMNEVPFLMVFSGVAYGYEQKTLDYLKNFPHNGKLLPLLRFMSFKSDIDLANETILALCERISEIKGDKDMLSSAQEIFKNQHSSLLSSEKKIKTTEKFYKKYGEIITNALYMLNNGSTGKDSDLNKIIFIEKDDYVDKDGNKKSGNKVFKKYYKSFRGLMDHDANFGKEEYMMDPFNKAGTSGLHLFKATNQLIELHQGGGFRHKESGAMMWGEISNEFEAVINRKYSDNYDEESIREKILRDMLRQFIAGVLENHAGNKNALSSFNKPGSVFSNKLNKWGVDLMEFARSGVSSAELLGGDNINGEKLLDKCIGIMLGKEDVDSSIGQKGIYDIGEILEETQEAASKAVGS